MLMSLFIKGIIIGLAVSVPLGPIGILIIQRTVNKDRVSGFLSGMGATITDVIYAVVAGFSLTYIIEFIRAHEIVFQILGAIMLLAMGLFIFLKNPVADLKKYKRKGSSYFSDILSTFLITFPNPLVVFIFLGIFASSGIVFQMDQPVAAFLLIGGIFLGANLWWMTLTGVVSLFRHKFNLRVLWWFNKIAGGVIDLLVLVTFLVSLLEHLSI